MMENDDNRISSVLNSIKNQTDYSLIEKLEFIKFIAKESEFKNFILIILLLIEKSQWHESASTLLLRKIYNENIYYNGGRKYQYGKLFLNIIKEKSFYPYSNISTTLRRLISSIIYDKVGDDTKHIVEINSKKDLLKVNEYFLEKYLYNSPIDKDCMLLYYNCVEDINNETSLITISKKANSDLMKKIESGALFDYLKIFIRPLYYSSSPNFDGKSYYVPEPFYKQIFGSHDDFIREIENEIKINPRNILLNEIKKFMEKYSENSNNDRPFVDVSTDIEITKELHSLLDPSTKN